MNGFEESKEALTDKEGLELLGMKYSKLAASTGHSKAIKTLQNFF